MKRIIMILVVLIGILLFIPSIIMADDNPVIKGYSVLRKSATMATINFISDTAGTAYYIVDENPIATIDDLVLGENAGEVLVNTTKTIEVNPSLLSSGAKYIHIVLESNSDSSSNILNIAMPYDVYYFDDFESYNDNVHPGFFNMIYNGSSAANQKIITLNENKVFNIYGTFGVGLDERIQISSISTGYAVLETDISVSSLPSEWYFGGIVIGPDYSNDNRNICVQVHSRTKKFVSGENNRNHTSNIVFETNKNYHVKMVLDVENKKLDYYVNNVKANESPITIASNYYTSLNWFGIYNGVGTVYYDNMKFYNTNTDPISRYTVIFNTNGGSSVANQTITSGGTVSEPAVPTKENYTFGGWYSDEELETEFDLATPITAPTTIYAKWNPIFNMTGTWYINIPSDGSAFTGTVTITEQIGTGFIGTFKVNSELSTNIVNGQIRGNNVTFDRNIGSRYQNYNGTLDVSTGTATIIGSFNDIYTTFKMTKMLPIITGNTVWRSNGTNANIRFISDTTGIAYYMITNSDVAPTITDLVINGTNGGSVTAGTTKSISLIGLTSGSKYVYIVVKNGDSFSNVITVEMPCDYYYSEDFESYNEGTNISTGSLSPISQVHNGTGNTNQKVISQVENNVLSLNSSSNLASDQIISLDPTKFSTVNKYVLEGRVYVPNDVTEWRARLGFTNGIYGGTNEVGIYFKDGSIVYNSDNASSILLETYEANKWYNIKIEVSPLTSKYSIYIDGVLKGDGLPLTSNINCIALSSGHNYTVLYDDIKFYIQTVNTYSITKGAEANGTFTIDKTSATQGEIVTINPTATDGYRVKSVKINDSETGITNNTANYTFTMPAEDVEVTVEFELIPKNITINDMINGTITSDKAVTVPGETVTLTVIPATNYKLKNISILDMYDDMPVTLNSDNTFIMPSYNVFISAEFEVIPVRTSRSSPMPTYKIIVSECENGGISPNTVSVTKYKEQKFIITPDEGYEIEDVLVDEKSVGKVLTYTFEKVTEKHTIKVIFKKIEEEKPEELIEEIKYNDVTENDWFYDTVNYVSKNKLMNGVEDNNFAPNSNITRGMLVTVMYRLSGANETAKATFTDVDKNEYYSEAIAWASENGIVNGVGNNNFAPDRDITREEMVAILFRFAKFMKEDVSVGEDTNILSYADALELNDWSISAFQWLCGAGIVNGRTESTLVPNGNATRAEFATIIMRYIENNR